MTGWRTWLALVRLRRELRRCGVPGAQRREIAADVRANLHAAAADFGEREALRRLGSLRTIAASYAEGRREARLHVGAGITAAAIVFATLAVLTLIRVPTFNAVDVFDRRTGATTWSWEVWRLWQFGGDVRTDTLFEGTIYWPAFVLLPMLAFLAWSRPWRLIRPRDPGAEPASQRRRDHAPPSKPSQRTTNRRRSAS